MTVLPSGLTLLLTALFCAPTAPLGWLPPSLVEPALALTPWVQPALDEDRVVDEEIRLAVGLAKEFQFVDMALEVLKGLQGADLDNEQARRVDRAKCDVFGEAALNERDEMVREERFVQALDQYKKFIEDREDEQGELAKQDFVNLASNYGEFMVERLDEASGEEALRIRGELEDRLNRVSFFATETIVDLKQLFNQLGPKEKDELFRLMLSQGNLLVILANVSEGGSSYLDNASELMEELAFMAGGDTGAGLTAYHLIGRVEAARGNVGDSIDYYEYVVTTLIPESDEEWESRKEDLGETNTAAVWNFYEREVSWYVDGLMAAGRPEKAVEAGLRFYNIFLRDGYDLAPFGHLSMLSAARALLDTGGFVGGSVAAGDLRWFASTEDLEAAGVGKRNRTTAAELALEMANRVNTANRFNSLQVRAQRLIREVVDSGLEVTPDVLFEAALGSYYGEDFDAAADGLRTVIANLETEADRKLFMPKVQKSLGDALRRSGRELEAALAYREGVAEWRGDEEYDAQNAQGFYSMMVRLRGDLKDVPEIETLFREAEVFQSSIGPGGGSIEWTRALREYDASEWEACRELCLGIEAKTDYHEKSMVRAAVCLYRLGDLDLAENELTQYLEVFVEDPRNRIAQTEPQLLKLRNEARAEAVYYLGQIDREREDWEGLLERYATFPEDFRGQNSLISTSLLYRLEASVETGQDDLADRLLDRMVDEFPKESVTGSAATKLYNSYVQRFEAATPGTEEARVIKGKMAETLSLSNQLKDDPSLNALSMESSFWVDAELWERADDILTEIRETFGEDADEKTQSTLKRTILPRHGQVQLELKRIAEAYDTLAPLVPAHDDKEAGLRPSVKTIQTYCRSVTGWLEGSGDSPTRVPGVGGAEPLENASKWLEKIAKGQEEYSCEWFETTYLRIFALYQLGQVDSSKSTWAGIPMKTLKVEFGPTYSAISEKCGGDDTLKGRFRWLASKI